MYLENTLPKHKEFRYNTSYVKHTNKYLQSLLMQQHPYIQFPIVPSIMEKLDFNYYPLWYSHKDFKVKLSEWSDRGVNTIGDCFRGGGGGKMVKLFKWMNYKHFYNVNATFYCMQGLTGKYRTF